MQPLFYDAETTIKNRGEDAIGKHQATAFHPDNKIVWHGWKTPEEHEVNIHDNSAIPDCRNVSLLIAHNLAFDLHHLMKRSDDWQQWVRVGCVWDTMLAEYLLTGQDAKFASLDDLAIKYGGTVKDSRMKEYWKAGICTSDIPEDEILPYLEGDVLNLEYIFYGQLEEADRLGMLPLIQSQMQARLATAVMEFNGMFFDKAEAQEQSDKLKIVYNLVEEDMKDFMATRTGLDFDELNPNSNAHLSAVLFGGTIPVTRKLDVLDEDGEPVRFKGGKRKGEIKTKNTRIEIAVEGLFDPLGNRGKNGCYAVGDDVIRKLIKQSDCQFLQNIKTIREYKKQISTYFDGYKSLVFPDGCIHGNLNHCLTNTGRLSSSQPNLQNISGKESSV